MATSTIQNQFSVAAAIAELSYSSWDDLSNGSKSALSEMILGNLPKNFIMKVASSICSLLADNKKPAFNYEEMKNAKSLILHIKTQDEGFHDSSQNSRRQRSGSSQLELNGHAPKYQKLVNGERIDPNAAAKQTAMDILQEQTKITKQNLNKSNDIPTMEILDSDTDEMNDTENDNLPTPQQKTGDDVTLDVMQNLLDFFGNKENTNNSKSKVVKSSESQKNSKNLTGNATNISHAAIRSDYQPGSSININGKEHIFAGIANPTSNVTISKSKISNSSNQIQQIATPTSVASASSIPLTLKPDITDDSINVNDPDSQFILIDENLEFPESYIKRSNDLVLKQGFIRCRAKYCISAGNGRAGSIQELLEHVRTVHKGQIFCTKCHKVLLGIRLAEHAKVCTLQCPVCFKEFQETRYVQRHMKRVHGAKLTGGSIFIENKIEKMKKEIETVNKQPTISTTSVALTNGSSSPASFNGISTILSNTNNNSALNNSSVLNYSSLYEQGLATAPTIASSDLSKLLDSVSGPVENNTKTNKSQEPIKLESPEMHDNNSKQAGEITSIMDNLISNLPNFGDNGDLSKLRHESTDSLVNPLLTLNSQESENDDDEEEEDSNEIEEIPQILEIQNSEGQNSQEKFNNFNDLDRIEAQLLQTKNESGKITPIDKTQSNAINSDLEMSEIAEISENLNMETKSNNNTTDDTTEKSDLFKQNEQSIDIQNIVADLQTAEETKKIVPKLKISNLALGGSYKTQISGEE